MHERDEVIKFLTSKISVKSRFCGLLNSLFYDCLYDFYKDKKLLKNHFTIGEITHIMQNTTDTSVTDSWFHSGRVLCKYSMIFIKFHSGRYDYCSSDYYSYDCGYFGFVQDPHSQCIDSCRADIGSVLSCIVHG